MEYQQIYLNNDIRAEISYFYKKEKISECHAVFHVLSCGENYVYQLAKLYEAYADFLEKTGLIPVFNRYFLSDIENQINDLQVVLNNSDHGVVSIIQQPPLNGSKIALWVWLMPEAENINIQGDNGLTGFRCDRYTHYFAGQMREVSGSPQTQPHQILNRYENAMERAGCSMENNCVRTWLFVSDIDNNYAGVVQGRKKIFNDRNLTENTHYIASTGIAGRHSNPQTILTFDAYAVEGLRQEQIQFLYAPDHLSRTSDYGVTFERGVCLHFEDKKQVFISGTASIDKTGHVVHEGDVIKQADRMIENVSELLKEADMDFSHMAQIIVYLRDIADYDVISAKMEKEFPQVPKIIVFAPICRPAWLVEMECIALK